MKDRTILWVLLAVVVGFTLPVGGCVGAGVITLGAMGLMARGTAPTAAISGDAVAVIRLDGPITSGSVDYLNPQTITPEHVSGLLELAAVDPAVKAVVLHINSPGGSVVASDRIYRALLAFEKPIVVWMGEVAASGGYYIACGSDYILAHPDTLTGSIGVISQFINAEELMNKIGVEAVVIASGPRKDTGSLFREMTEEEKALWEAITDEIYGSFVGIVAQARDLPLDEVRTLADGRVYTGRQAADVGLVDEVGALNDAIAKAAELGGIEGTPVIIELHSEPSFFDLLYSFQLRATTPTFQEILSWAGTPSLEYKFVGP